ncbi:tetratricopeptide repeat protein [Thiorhodococcus mannitoliphagus]|uniref:protein O-GlcNAc transferase n=1 Tax=Thiorhodococcus mannitoliphagus TaxID=329406 RepID=A0A6P1E149_9GAMM|nr:tetratricopeptide repeat protein [Thiorhodococcus mannitoliphagus]
MTDCRALLEQATAHHESGRLTVAEHLYRAALALDGNLAETHHRLGALLLELGQSDEGLDHLRRAVERSSSTAGYWEGWALGLLIARSAQQALMVIDQALALGIDTPSAHSLRAQILGAISDQEFLASAEIGDTVLGSVTGSQVSADNLGSESKKALPAHQSAKPRARSRADRKRGGRASSNPVVKVSAANRNDFVSLLLQGRLEPAESFAQRLIERYPSDSFGWQAAASVEMQRLNYKAALPLMHKAVELSPEHSECLTSLGNILRELGQQSEAIAYFRLAIKSDPDCEGAYNGLGMVFQDLRRIDEAISCYLRALQIDPNQPKAHSNLGSAYRSKGLLDLAVASCNRALSIDPQLMIANNVKAASLQDLGRFDEALACYDLGLINASDKNAAVVYSNRLFLLSYHPDKSPQEIYEAHLEFDRVIGAPLRGHWRPHTNVRDPERRLRVGYVSPDFRKHVVSYYLEALMASHDKRQVEVTAYADLAREDEVTARFRTYADHWVPTNGVSDLDLAERIRADGIDILVDLSGHTALNRLRTFACRPAPVAVSWLGYANTTGLRAIDYVAVDAFQSVDASDALYIEQLWRVPNPAGVYRPSEGMGGVGSLPAEVHGFVTFGTLTRGIRMNDRVIRVWSTILQRLEGARLVIDSSSFVAEKACLELAERFAVHGICPERLSIGCHTPPWDILRSLDITLDPFPHNSSTTLFESLYLGVPVITLLGHLIFSSRMGGGILAGVGHPEWIATTEEEYIEKAVALASDLEALARIRANLRAEFEASPWRDEPGFARKMEQAYRGMWRRWCEHGQGPADLR